METFELDESVAFTDCQTCKFNEECDDCENPMAIGWRRHGKVLYEQCIRYVDSNSGESFKTILASKSREDYCRFLEMQNKELIKTLKRVLEDIGE